MHKNMKKGYISFSLNKKSDNNIIDFVNSLDESIFAYKNINGKIIRGKEKDLHMTLFFGIDDEKLDIEKMNSFLESVKLKSLNVKEIDLFDIEGIAEKLLVIKLEKTEELEKLRNALLNFDYFEDRFTNNYIPHITLGYVRPSVNISDISLDIKSVDFEKPLYKAKNF
jgi:2'-5' RNA ligase